MKLVLPKHINMPSENHYQVIIILSSRPIKPNFDLGQVRVTLMTSASQFICIVRIK